MHPIERLRYVARAGWAGPSALGAEAACALAELADYEPAALLPACRRLLERNPSCGPLWWVAARMLSAGDPVAEADRCVEELEDDPTESLLEEALADGRRVVRHGGVAEVAAADVVVVDTDALGPTGMIADADDDGLLEAARVCEVEVWASAGTGRVLPPRLWHALLQRLDRPSVATRHAGGFFDVASAPRTGALRAITVVARIAGPFGLCRPEEALALARCPEPPELVSGW